MNNSYKLADGSYSTDYIVGDTFEVVEDSGMTEWTSQGEILTFEEDYMSEWPCFEGRCSFHMGWFRLKPTSKTLAAVQSRKRGGGIKPVEYTPDPTFFAQDTPKTPRQILEAAFQEVFDVHGVAVNGASVDWTNCDTHSGANRRVTDINIVGDCAK